MKMGRGVRRGGDYSREVIILNISVKGGRLFEGQLLFKDIWYFKLNTMLPLVPYANKFQFFFEK